MKTIKINLYQFKELEPDARAKVLSDFYDINTFEDWWKNTYEDASQIGFTINAFDLDPEKVHGVFPEYAYHCANKIVENHGDTCQTYKTAKAFISDYDRLVEKYSDGVNKDEVAEENQEKYDLQVDALEKDFLYNICRNYRDLLKEDHEYRRSELAIIETIEINEYWFREDGSLHH